MKTEFEEFIKSVEGVNGLYLDATVALHVIFAF